MSSSVRIVEVGPRNGLQNEPSSVPTATKRLGLRIFDSAVSGLGGCPYAYAYAKGASGNVATEDVVYLFHSLGVETGIDLDKLINCSAWISAALGRAPGSRVARALLPKRTSL